jgi:hypothetical protein
MLKSMQVKVALLALVLVAVLGSIGCDMATGGAEITLEGVTFSGVAMEGKPITGLPSDKVNIIIKAKANKVSVRNTSQGVSMTLNPSGATIDFGANGISIKGVKPEEMQMEWLNK